MVVNSNKTTVASPIRKTDQELMEVSQSAISKVISYIIFLIAMIIFYITQIGIGAGGCAICLFCCNLDKFPAILMSLAPLFQAVVIITALMVSDIYDEIQSWHMAWLAWASTFALTSLYADCCTEDDSSAIAVTLRFVTRIL